MLPNSHRIESLVSRHVVKNYPKCFIFFHIHVSFFLYRFYIIQYFCSEGDPCGEITCSQPWWVRLSLFILKHALQQEPEGQARPDHLLAAARDGTRRWIVQGGSALNCSCGVLWCHVLLQDVVTPLNQSIILMHDSSV